MLLLQVFKQKDLMSHQQQQLNLNFKNKNKMALQITEIYNILNGIVRPEKMALLDMVTIMAKKHSQYFLDNEKETAAGTPEDSYRLKIDALAQRVKQKDGSVLLNLVDSLVIHISNFTNYSTVKLWDDTGWQTMLEAEIPTVFDKVADVKAAEKSAYDGLGSN